MMDRCQAWIDISDRVLLNERVTSAERAFLREHEAVCATCARESGAWSELRPNALHSVPEPAEVEAIIESAAATTPLPSIVPVASSKRPWRQRGVAAVAAGVLITAVAATFLRLGADDPHGTSEVQLRRDGVTGSLAPAPNSAAVVATAEDTCGEVGDGVTLCVAAGSELPTFDLDTPHRSVLLKRGRVIASLESQVLGTTTFSVITDKGRIAGGPLYSVEVDESGAVTARVMRGSVLVHGASGRGQALLAGQLLRLGERYSMRLPDDERERDLSLLERLAPAAFIRQYAGTLGQRNASKGP